MDRIDKKNWLIGALLCIALALPTFFIGDHIHESLGEEISCDQCLHGTVALPSDDSPRGLFAFFPAGNSPEPAIIPLERFNLFEYQRGPPVLC